MQNANYCLLVGYKITTGSIPYFFPELEILCTPQVILY